MSPAPPPPTSCRLCRAEVLATDLTCPHCGAPRPARAEFSGEGYEWRTAATWLGAPLIHVAFGMDAEGRPRVARGVIAIGQRARGGVAIGLIATGFVAIGLVAVGLFSIGLVAIAALGALGVNAIAPWAVGVVALGYWAGGLAPLGWHILFGRS
ncbi:MAG TPA: hypothetical protein VGO11_03850 [Chthoniobacteraceae bacterium]|nr:hypothetical protein [Chthoniobacteraceae bacterium]